LSNAANAVALLGWPLGFQLQNSVCSSNKAKLLFG